MKCQEANLKLKEEKKIDCRHYLQMPWWKKKIFLLSIYYDSSIQSETHIKLSLPLPLIFSNLKYFLNKSFTKCIRSIVKHKVMFLIQLSKLLVQSLLLLLNAGIGVQHRRIIKGAWNQNQGMEDLINGCISLSAHERLISYSSFSHQPWKPLCRVIATPSHPTHTVEIFL